MLLTSERLISLCFDFGSSKRGFENLNLVHETAEGWAFGVPPSSNVSVAPSTPFFFEGLV
jgi:hypothetical protein